MKKKLQFGLALAAMMGFTACNDDDGPGMPVYDEVTVGYYILCEGTYGQGDGTLSYYELETETLTNGVYATANPGKTIGETPSDIKIYGSKMYITALGENKVLVMNAKDAKQIQEIPLDGGRSMVCYDGAVYVSTYEGKVAKIDTTSLSISGTATVTGKYCEGITALKDKIYVVNNATPTGYQGSGNTISVIDPKTMTETDQITVPGNPINIDAAGDYLYVQTAGDYITVEGQLHRVNPTTKTVDQTVEDVSRFTIYDGVAYTTYFSWIEFKQSVQKINLANGTATAYVTPEPYYYNVMANPGSGYIYYMSDPTMDGKNNVTCYDKDAVVQYTTGSTGNRPAAIVFHNKLVEKK